MLHLSANNAFGLQGHSIAIETQRPVQIIDPDRDDGNTWLHDENSFVTHHDGWTLRSGRCLRQTQNIAIGAKIIEERLLVNEDLGFF